MLRRTMVVAVSLIGTARGAAQSPVAAGVTVGVAQLSAARTEQVVTGVLQLRPRPWLALSAIPSVVRLSHDTSGATVASGGLGDLPLVAGATATLPAPWTPTLGGALIVSLPTGDAACGFGSGETTLGIDAGLGVAPASRLRFSADASRNLSGIAGPSLLRLEGAADVAPRWTLGVGVGAEVGTGDSLARSVGGGITRALAGAMALTVNASHGLTAASARWVVSVGIGTVYSGISPVAPTSPLRRLQGSFAGGVGRGGGHGNGKAGACS